jgi:hypothetical protein
MIANPPSLTQNLHENALKNFFIKNQSKKANMRLNKPPL